jgi:serine/threonine protein kinase
MDPVRWREVKSLFAAALSAPESQRPKLVQHLAGADIALVEEVLSLLRAHTAAERENWHGPFSPSKQNSNFSPPTVDPRFAIESFLGAGGFGVVFRAWDRLRERHVAIKTLRQAGPMGLMRLKNEFRTLADLTHPNLLRLYELFAGDSGVYFSMELVDGVRLIPFPLRDHATSDSGRSHCPILVSAFLQFAEGVNALHHAGVLHGDLKPSNVLITATNRVVILDFGLASTLPQAEGTDVSKTVVQLGGTPGYMAPELLMGQPATKASDWYAFGVMLIEALCPNQRTTTQSVSMNSVITEPKFSPVKLDEFPEDVPPELATLCLELTNPHPDSRPKGRNIVERLAAFASISARAANSSQRTSRSTTQIFVGRNVQLSQLRNLSFQARQGRIAAALICGRSGMGKTALVRNFLEDQRDQEPSPLILTARCHEREALTYKAFDGIVDGLSFAFKRLSPTQLAKLRLHEVRAVARLFPVLKQFRDIADPIEESRVSSDAHEQRRQAFDAFRELLSRFSELAPLVIFIDDVQWGDLDSAALLRHLVRPPNPPPITWLIACREEELAAHVTARIIEALAVTPGGYTQISVGALAESEIRELARRELGMDNPVVETVVREAAGVPIFAQELLFEARRAPASLTGSRVLPRLEAVMTARLSRLSPPERALLDVVAVAAKPLLRTIARQVAGLDTTIADDAEHQLISKKLLRHGEGGLAVETYHDSIRELTSNILNPQQNRILHGALADALLSRGDSVPEDIAYHLKSAGATERAADFAEQAAKRAAATLAFGRAAALYRMALELRPSSHPDTGSLTIELAQALSNAGRGMEAATAFEHAAKLLPAQTLPLTCKAAEQLLQSGDINRGRTLISGLLREFGWHVPESRWRIVASIAMRRLQLSLRGLSYRPRNAVELSQKTLVRLDASWALVSGLSLIDTVYANYFQNHHLIHALDAGEPRRLLRALAAESAHASMTATPVSRQRGLIVLDKLRRLAAKHPTEPIGEPMVAIGTALWAWMFGDWATCHLHAARAAHLFRTRCTGVTWELGTSRTFTLGSLIILGRYNEYQRMWPELMEDARARGDMFAETKLILIDLSHGAALANDEPEYAEREVLRALSMWNRTEFDLQEYWALHARVEIAIYQGDAEKAWTLIEERRNEISRSLLLHMKNLRIFIRQTRARAALALAAQSAERRPKLLREASRDIRAISRERLPWGNAMVTLLSGLMHQIMAKNDHAIQLLSQAALQLAQCNMASYAAAARLAHAELLGGEPGKSLATEAELQMHLLGVRIPDKLGRMLAPRRALEC